MRLGKLRQEKQLSLISGSLSQKSSPRRVDREEWCGREDSNFHGVASTATSTLRVYQFRHDRISVFPLLPLPNPPLQCKGTDSVRWSPGTSRICFSKKGRNPAFLLDGRVLFVRETPAPLLLSYGFALKGSIRNALHRRFKRNAFYKQRVP